MNQCANDIVNEHCDTKFRITEIRLEACYGNVLSKLLYDFNFKRIQSIKTCIQTPVVFQ